MATLTFNALTSTVTFGDIATLTIGKTEIVNASASELHIRSTVAGTITGTLDVTFTGNFTLLAGVPVDGAFTGLSVAFNNETIFTASNFTLPLSASQAPDLDSLMAQILGGDDILTGAALADVLQGFAGLDNIDGGGGADIINGNSGNDTVAGGDGADVVRGGKDNDVVMGGAGDDFLSGDRGSDTVTGGAGADIFHTFTGAGLDRVTDFNAAEGDRVLMFKGTSYTLTQSGSDLIVDLGSDDQMVLVGVQQSSLPSDWLITI